MPGLYLPRFDPAADFVAIRNFRFGGKILLRGADFPKPDATLRKLQQLYETRYIAFKGETQVRDAEVVRPRRRARPEALNEQADKAATDVEGPTPDLTFDERVEALQEAHTKKELLTMADGLELPHRPNKTEIATAILKAGDGTA